jgi:Stealth protein CR2, conserved region 2/Stealth protein CR3, conserved region 3
LGFITQSKLYDTQKYGIYYNYLFSESYIGQILVAIDAVYTWVNHCDPAWVDAYSAVQKELVGVAQSHESVNDIARFQSRDELIYSIKSVRRYAPWIDKIFVVTNCSLPIAVLEDQKVIRIAHEEIFSDTSALPTFNSHAIEANLHRVPNLSEKFLYFNDDFFLCKPVLSTDFFSESGKPYVFLSKHNIPYQKKYGLRPVDVAAINAGKLLEADFDFRPEKKLHHAPYPLLKSTLFEIESLYGPQLLSTMRQKFRTNFDLPLATTLHAYYSLSRGYGQIEKMECRYIDIGDPLFIVLIGPFSALRRGKYKTFCLNEVKNVGRFSGIRDYIVKGFLKRMFYG